MSRKKVIGIALLIGAILIGAGGSFTLHAGHNKTGLGIIVLGIIVLALSLYTFFSRSTAEKYQVDREWM
jgi:drug/metabolite transporter (DMT)-like permease